MTSIGTWFFFWINSMGWIHLNWITSLLNRLTNLEIPSFFFFFFFWKFGNSEYKELKFYKKWKPNKKFKPRRDHPSPTSLTRDRWAARSRQAWISVFDINPPFEKTFPKVFNQISRFELLSVWSVAPQPLGSLILTGSFSAWCPMPPSPPLIKDFTDHGMPFEVVK